MEVDLAGQIAWVSGPPSALKDAIAAALAANGAALVSDAPSRLDVLVVLAETPTQAADQIAHVAGKMRAGSRVAIVTSVLGLVPVRGEAAGSVAAAGIVQLTRALAMEHAGAGILVNAVAVGALAGDRLAERLRSHAQFGPATLGDVVNAVLFAVDPASSYLTGHVLTVDGGWTAGYTRDF